MRHFILTAACYEHRPHIGLCPERVTSFSETLLDALPNAPAAWCVLPNHYHLLIRCGDVQDLVQLLGRIHGRTSLQWNREENLTGRKVWHGSSDRAMRDTRHFWATLNYIHHNPVRHGYAETWQDWPWSSASDYLSEVGKKQAEAVWKDYPILEYGKGWDDAAM